MSRSTDYLRKPTENWITQKARLEETTFYLVQRFGPTVFSIRSEEGQLYKVTIGDPHKCSCSCRPGEHCLHTVFCLLKVLRIPCENHMSWQTGFTDTEVEIVLAGNFGGRRSRPVVRRERPTAPVEPSVCEGGADGTGCVQRQPLEGEECYCPICQDLMNNTQALSWCRKGCGNNMHAKCMKMYAQYKLESKADVSCPLCREDWVSMAELNEDCRSSDAVKTRCAAVACSSCSTEMRGDFYRCIECSLSAIKQPDVIKDGGKAIKTNMDFCKNCFDRIGRAHSCHHFINSDVNSVYQEFTWQSAINPRGPSTSSKFPPELLLSLQGRELTAADYDLLMALDERKARAPPLSEMLIESLPEVSSQNSIGLGLSSSQSRSHMCHICRQPQPPATVVSIPSDPISVAIAQLKGVSCEITAFQRGGCLRMLPCCQGMCHTACLESSIKLTLSKDAPQSEADGDGTLADISAGAGCLLDRVLCSNDACKRPVFARLTRRKRKKSLVVAPAVQPTEKDEVLLSTGFGISGTGLLGHGCESGQPVAIVGRDKAPVIKVKRTVARRNENIEMPQSQSQLALNAMHMSMAGHSTAMTQRSEAQGPRKLAKGLTTSASRRAGGSDLATQFLTDNISLVPNVAPGLPPSGRAPRQVGGRGDGGHLSGRQKLNRLGSFRGDIRATRDISDSIYRGGSAAGVVGAETLDLIVRSVSADAGSHVAHVGGMDFLVGDGEENALPLCDGNAAFRWDMPRSRSRDPLANADSNGSSLRYDSSLGSTVERHATGRVAKGSLVKASRTRSFASTADSGTSGAVQLCLNVNHYA